MAENDELSGPLLGAGVSEVHNFTRSLTDHYGYNSPMQVPPSWFDIRVHYVRVSSSLSAEAPELLIMRYPPRSITTALELNGARIAPSEEAILILRRDKVDTESAEVMYVSTESLRTSGTLSFEVCHKGESLLGGTLERRSTLIDPLDYRIDDSVNTLSETIKLEWNMNCTCAVGSQSCVFLKGRHELLTGLSPSLMEVCVVGRYSGFPVFLTHTVELTARRRHLRRGTLDVIPEGDESERSRNRNDRLMVDWAEHIAAEEKAEVRIKAVEELKNFYPDNGGYADGEDGDVSWFNAGVRVGVGVGLGMCLGVGIGIGLMVRTYQATAKSFRRGLF